jgi:5-methylcytosine-specific restriction endonuclease McrA
MSTWQENRTKVIRKARRRCEFCGLHEDDHGKSLDVHHIWPRRFGGGNEERNLTALCRSCHKKIEHVTQLLKKDETNPLKAAHLEIAKRKRPELAGGVAEEMVARARYEWADSESE